MKGFVNWFDKDLGYGFIIGEDGESYFVHFRDIHHPVFKTLKEAQKVEFDGEKTPKGFRASNVHCVSSVNT